MGDKSTPELDWKVNTKRPNQTFRFSQKRNVSQYVSKCVPIPGGRLRPRRGRRWWMLRRWRRPSWRCLWACEAVREPRQTLVKFSQLHTQVTSTIDKSVAQTANFFHGTSYILWHGTWWWRTFEKTVRTIRRKLWLIYIKSKAFIFIVSYTYTFDQFISCECDAASVTPVLMSYLQGTCTSFCHVCRLHFPEEFRKI